MTTFTTQDREDAEKEPVPFAGWIQHSDDTVTKAKSLVEQAPYQPGYEDAVPQMEKPSAEPVAWLWINNGITYNALLRDPMCNDHSKEHWVKKGWSSKPLYATQTTLSDEELNILSNAVENYICSIKVEITDEERKFKGYEHCSNLNPLMSELDDALRARTVLERHGIGGQQ